MPPTRIAVTIAVLTLLGTACVEERSDGATGEDARLQAASQGLCDAQVLVSEGDVVRAAEVFDRETHDYLHELAGMLQEVDRQAAAELLEVKQRLESTLATPERADPGAVAALIPELQRALADGSEAAGLPVPLCIEGAA